MSLKQLALKYLPGPILRGVRSRHYQRQLKNYPLSAEPDLLGCKALLRSGDTVLDVGANIGVYTRFCSEFVGPEGHVYSLEPVPETYTYLARNVAHMALSNVECYNIAASDKDQEHAAMSMPEYTSGGSNIYEAKLSEQGDIPVKTNRLDTLFPQLSPQLIKCDVEGHELACLEGARELIARAKPWLVVEVSNPKTFDLLASFGYEGFVWKDGRFQAVTPSDRVPNYFFFPRGESAALAAPGTV